MIMLHTDCIILLLAFAIIGVFFFTYKINTVFVTLNETIDVNELREVGLYSSKGILKILDILVKLRMSLISVGYRGGAPKLAILRSKMEKNSGEGAYRPLPRRPHPV